MDTDPLFMVKSRSGFDIGVRRRFMFGILCLSKRPLTKEIFPTQKLLYLRLLFINAREVLVCRTSAWRHYVGSVITTETTSTFMLLIEPTCD
jgi:hypothetical protein